MTEPPEHHICRYRTPSEEAAVRHAEQNGARLRREARMTARVAYDCIECGVERPAAAQCPHCGSVRPIG